MSKENVIFSYTAEQALEDGVLVRPLEKEGIYLFTSAVHECCEKEASKGERTYQQVAYSLLQDCVLEANKSMLADASETSPYSAWPAILDGTVAGTVWVMPNELGGLTVMTPDDY